MSGLAAIFRIGYLSFKNRVLRVIKVGYDMKGPYFVFGITQCRDLTETKRLMFFRSIYFAIFSLEFVSKCLVYFIFEGN